MVLERLYNYLDKDRKSSRLPSAGEFRTRLFRLRHTEAGRVLPPVPDHPTASEMAQYGQVDWPHIEGKILGSGGRLHTYLHELAKFMLTPEGYLGTSREGIPINVYIPSLHVREDEGILPIRVKDDWRVGYEGNNRTLILKILGPKFIEEAGMNEWVNIVKE